MLAGLRALSFAPFAPSVPRSFLARRANNTINRMSSSSASSPLVAAAAARVKYQAPVPSDIDISQSIEPIHISKIAEDAGASCGENERTSSRSTKTQKILTPALLFLFSSLLLAGILPEELDLYGRNKGKVHLSVLER